MQKINLLFAITKLELGGAQKQLLTLIRHLDKNRYRIFLYTAKEGLLVEDALKIEGLTIKCSDFLERPISPLKDILALIGIFRFIKKNDIHIVHTHSSKAGILGRFAAKLAKAGIIIHTVHGWPFNDYQPLLLKKIYIFLEKTAARFTDKLITVSYFDKQAGLNNHIGTEQKYIVIRYGIDFKEFEAPSDELAIRKQFNINTDDVVVVMVSCFKLQKSVQDFIRLAHLLNKTIPNLKFVLVGDGAEHKKIENLIKGLKLQGKVILAGWRRDIPRILHLSDTFVLTSLWEGLPISVLEAFACSKSVAATDTGGIREIVLHGRTGFLAPSRDLNKMQENLTILLKDRDLRLRMGENARRSITDDFTVTKMVSDTQNIYEALYAG